MALRRESLIESPLAFGASPEDDRAGSVEEVRRFLDEFPDGVTFGAFETDLVGMVGLVRQAKRKMAHKMVIWGVYVQPGHRGTGVAPQLFEAAIDHAQALPGVRQIQLSVSETAPAARKLYERFGFEVWGTEPEALQHDGEFVAEHHMSLRIQPQNP